MRAPGHGRTWDTSSSRLILGPGQVGSCCRSANSSGPLPFPTILLYCLDKLQAGHLSLEGFPGVGARLGEDRLINSAGGSQRGWVAPPPIPRGQEEPGLHSSRISKVAAQRGWLLCLHLEETLRLSGVQAGWGRDHQEPGVMGLESTASPEALAWEGAQLSPHKLG